MYSFEDTAALYCLICGKSCSATIAGHDASGSLYFYNTILPGKTIYNHVINFGDYAGSSPYAGLVEAQYIINNKIIYYHPGFDSSSSFTTNGYHNLNAETLDAAVAIQNVFEFYRKGKSNWGASINLNYASVLITS
jgi:hypothetical protein